ncbi:MAG: hypothetical protein ACYT04_34825 [Nostoc sp.]
MGIWTAIALRRKRKGTLPVYTQTALAVAINEDAVLKSRPLWLAWVGMEMPQLCDFWRLYLQRL